jgi:hypothetical protein
VGSVRSGAGLAFVLPATIALFVAVVAFSVRVGETWFSGVLALVVGLGVASVANGRRRFLTWAGALGAVFGVLLVTGDTSSRVNSTHTADGVLHFGILAMLFGVAAVLAARPIAAPPPPPDSPPPDAPGPEGVRPT